MSEDRYYPGDIVVTRDKMRQIFISCDQLWHERTRYNEVVFLQGRVHEFFGISYVPGKYFSTTDVTVYSSEGEK
jgi:hypothetical protein